MPITLGGQLVGLVLHPHQQFLGGGRADACAVLNVKPLAAYLHPHALDLDAEEHGDGC
ncbi:MAG: hypothetical protein Q7V17_06125 [Afipia sp.]|nr:hypothetical protein [Afipia sp.]